MTIRRILIHPDGRHEHFKPYLDNAGRYVLHTKQTEDPLHFASNQVFATSLEEVAAMLRGGRHHLRMLGDDNLAPSLIAPQHIEIIEE